MHENTDRQWLTAYDISQHKVMTAMDESKRERLFTAAMVEFGKGYAAASTDEISKTAGVSKGLLYHYFGSKSGMFLFLVQYCTQLLSREYANVIFKDRDFLDNIWEISKRKMELSFAQPVLFKFLTKAYFSYEEAFPEGIPKELTQAYEVILGQIFNHSDKSRFRDDIDVEKGQRIIFWTMKGLGDSMLVYGSDIEAYHVHYDACLSLLKDYLQLLRKLLYQ